MSSDLSFVQYVAEQLSGTDGIVIRKMFGEYGIHKDGKYIACVCDNRLFVKPTAAGRAVLGAPVEAAPYEGYDGKELYFLIEDTDDRELLTRLFEATWAALPAPKKKPAR